MSPELQMLLTIGTPIAAVALSYGGIRAMVKSLQKDLGDLSTKVVALEKEKATTAQVQSLESMMNSSIKNFDLKVSMQEGVVKKTEVDLATVRASQEEFQRRHNDAVTDFRNKTATLEGRATNMEQNMAETRAQLNAMIQGVSRVEAKQDREASSLEQIRRDLLEFVVNNNGNRRRKNDEE